MNRVIGACLKEFENQYERTQELNHFSNQYNDLIKKLDNDMIEKLSEVLSEMQLIQQAEFFEAGFKYGLSLKE